MHLGRKEYGTVTLVPGSHHFVGLAKGSPDVTVVIDVKPGVKTCLKISGNSANYARLLIPILTNLTNPFSFDVVPCPTAEELTDFDKGETA
ncbi:MAG: hypothetical protein NVS9B15_02880 [Acidobacteriaceae bacterium]